MHTSMSLADVQEDEVDGSPELLKPSLDQENEEIVQKSEERINPRNTATTVWPALLRLEVSRELTFALRFRTELSLVLKFRSGRERRLGDGTKWTTTRASRKVQRGSCPPPRCRVILAQALSPGLQDPAWL
ncbi:hypothetical protein AAFF_G00101600 [Aldrovandia affinis]|uniref:Uncharacterized protein n=1 Tax=Aldrovandia affinis TaxID=143900 RepID=A0AAD7WC73_9TELE|nr:hypothetical protein AAFF_G00101600 [Aldrovandia affinis]